MSPVWPLARISHIIFARLIGSAEEFLVLSTVARPRGIGRRESCWNFSRLRRQRRSGLGGPGDDAAFVARCGAACQRSEEHTSELQSPDHLVCRLLLEKKKKKVSWTGTAENRRTIHKKRSPGVEQMPRKLCCDLRHSGGEAESETSLRHCRRVIRCTLF